MQKVMRKTFYSRQLRRARGAKGSPDFFGLVALLLLPAPPPPPPLRMPLLAAFRKLCH
jgi:hypothetical protein